MITKTNNHQKNTYNVIATAIGAWAMTLATLIGMTDLTRQIPVIVATGNSAFITPNPTDLWTRKGENETVHMPTKFDIGLRMPGVTGRK